MTRAQALGAGLLGLGVLLRLWQYASGTSLWVDELALARSILDYGMLDLVTHPLGLDQTAPPAILLASAAVVRVLGANEYSWRLVPFAASLVSLGLFVVLSRRVLKPQSIATAVLVVALAPPLIAYGTQLKQYSTDVVATLAILLVSLPLVRPHWEAAQAWRAAAIGAVVVWASQSAVLTLTGCGVALAACAWRRRASDRRAIFAVLVAWAMAAGVATLHAFRVTTPETRAYLRRFWREALLPTGAWSFDHLRWLWRVVWRAFDSNALGYPLPWVYGIIALLGFRALYRRDPRVAALLAGPILVTMGAAIARQYPFHGRLITFLLPIFALALAEAATWLRALLDQRSPALGAAAMWSLAVGPLYGLMRYPPVYHVEDARSVLATLRDQRQPGDVVYTYYGAAPAVAYYGPHFDLPADSYLLGRCHRGDSRGYLAELDRLRGARRAWIIFVHALPALGERDVMLGYLNAIGSRQREWVFPGARLYLYDLSDPARLASERSESFSFTDVSGKDDRFGCDEGPLAPTERPGQLQLTGE